MARSLYRLPHSVSFGVRVVFNTLFFMTICSRSTLEEAKHLRRRDFGLLIGTQHPLCKGVSSVNNRRRLVESPFETDHTWSVATQLQTLRHLRRKGNRSIAPCDSPAYTALPLRDAR